MRVAPARGPVASGPHAAPVAALDRPPNRRRDQPHAAAEIQHRDAPPPRHHRRAAHGPRRGACPPARRTPPRDRGPSARAHRRARTTPPPPPAPPRWHRCGARAAPPTRSATACAPMTGVRWFSHDRGLSVASTAQSPGRPTPPRTATTRPGAAPPPRPARLHAPSASDPTSHAGQSGQHRTRVRFYARGYGTNNRSIRRTPRLAAAGQSWWATHSMPCHARQPR